MEVLWAILNQFLWKVKKNIIVNLAQTFYTLKILLTYHKTQMKRVKIFLYILLTTWEKRENLENSFQLWFWTLRLENLPDLMKMYCYFYKRENSIYLILNLSTYKDLLLLGIIIIIYVLNYIIILCKYLIPTSQVYFWKNRYFL